MTLSLTGSIQKKYEYSDYGQRSLDSKTEIINNELGYNGEAHTGDGLQYLRSRYYDPVTGSFISADSYRGEFSNLLSQNRYTYAHNNPYKYDDPTGHLPASGINKYASNALMDVGSGTSSNPTVKPPLPKPDKKPVNQQQNTNYNSGMLLRDVGRTPSVRTEAVMFDDGGDAGENSDDDDIGDKAAVIDNDSLQGDETEEVTGKAESSNVGTETRIETGEKDGGFVEFVYQEVIVELGSQIFENSSKNFDDFATFFATSAGISVPTVAGAKLVYPFKDTLKEMSGVAKYFTEELSKTGANLVKFGSSAVIGTAVGTISDMANGKDFVSAYSESVVKATVSSALMMGVVTIMSPSAPVTFLIGVGVSYAIEKAYENDFFGLQSISELYKEDINNRIEKFENNIKFVIDCLGF